MADLKHLSLTTELISCCHPYEFLMTVVGQMSCRKYKAFQLIYDPVWCKACNYFVVVANAKKKEKFKTCLMEKYFFELER